MALSKLKPDIERVKLIVLRMKEIMETTWLRNPSLNNTETQEFNGLKKELENMGLSLTWEAKLDPLKRKLTVDICLWIPKNTTVH